MLFRTSESTISTSLIFINDVDKTKQWNHTKCQLVTYFIIFIHS